MTVQQVNPAMVDIMGNHFIPNDKVFRDWTPTITQSVSVSGTITYARYITLAQVAIVQARITISSAGVANNAIVIGGQPSVIEHGNTDSGQSIIGSIIIFDSGTAIYHGALLSLGATDWRGMSDGSGSYIGIVPNFALASGDAIGIQAVYERA